MVDQLKRGEEYVAVERELERLEEVYRPSLEAEDTSLEFGDVECVTDMGFPAQWIWIYFAILQVFAKGCARAGSQEQWSSTRNIQLQTACIRQAHL